jgi:L-threonylcarbamoyladenylate synthase
VNTETIAGRDAIAAAVQQLLAGNVVAVPTETVYGLAADALNPHAVLKIFETKERPKLNPLIVHLPSTTWLERVAVVPQERLVRQLVERFWPGPLTLVLPRQAMVPDVVTAGLDTVAIRMSAHPLLTDILHAFGQPVAAPSANRSGRISPTTAAHVQEELGSRIPLIVDGGATEHGIESTIVAVRNSRIELLRRGPVTAEQLRDFAEVIESQTTTIEAPGQLPSHYAPNAQLLLVDELQSFTPAAGQRVGGLSFAAVDAPQFAELRTLSSRGDAREAAANLFRCLRELDSAAVDLIVAEQLPEEGLGAAINDRLRRAAAR